MVPAASITVASTHWEFPGGGMSLAEPRVMGVLNLTPDSFSDGGRLRTVDQVLRRAETMLQEGAHIVDVGGESTRPGSAVVSVDEELARVIPAVEALVRNVPLPVSVDTRKAAVAQAALQAGASVVNDVSGLAFDPEMTSVVAAFQAGLVVMHMRGVPSSMAQFTHYTHLVNEVMEELEEGLRRSREAGIPRERVVVDPGIGFAKTAIQSLHMLREVPRLLELGHPVLVGPSRKSFLNEVEALQAEERVDGTVSACVVAFLGGARIFRVHDVKPVARALRVAHAIREAQA
ncbi:MAG: dihydropteroate synthase [Gemmatimonadota bacterium]